MFFVFVVFKILSRDFNFLCCSVVLGFFLKFVFKRIDIFELFRILKIRREDVGGRWGVVLVYG